jgi:hypothetical protein
MSDIFWLPRQLQTQHQAEMTAENQQKRNQLMQPKLRAAIDKNPSVSAQLPRMRASLHAARSPQQQKRNASLKASMTFRRYSAFS